MQQLKTGFSSSDFLDVLYEYQHFSIFEVTGLIKFLINNMKNIYITFFWLALALCVVCFSIRVYAEITEDRPTDENIGKFGNHIWYDLR